MDLLGARVEHLFRPVRGRLGLHDLLLERRVALEKAIDLALQVVNAERALLQLGSALGIVRRSSSMAETSAERRATRSPSCAFSSRSFCAVCVSSSTDDCSALRSAISCCSVLCFCLASISTVDEWRVTPSSWLCSSPTLVLRSPAWPRSSAAISSPLRTRVSASSRSCTFASYRCSSCCRLVRHRRQLVESLGPLARQPRHLLLQLVAARELGVHHARLVAAHRAVARIVNESPRSNPCVPPESVMTTMGTAETSRAYSKVKIEVTNCSNAICRPQSRQWTFQVQGPP